MNEAGATAAIHKRLPSTEMEVWKIADRYRSGIPDAYYGGPENGSLWVEYKIIKNKTTPKQLDVSPASSGSSLSVKQEKWLNDHYARGHAIAVVVIHYRPRNSRYYVLLDKEWSGRNPTDDIISMDLDEYVHWILTSVNVRGEHVQTNPQ
jgi:hypothetical protein